MLGLSGSVSSVCSDDEVAEFLTSLIELPLRIAVARANIGLKTFAEDAEPSAATVDTMPITKRVRTMLRLVLTRLMMERTARHWGVILMDSPTSVETDCIATK